MMGFYSCVDWTDESENKNKSVFKMIQHYSYVELRNKNKKVL